LSGVEDFNVHPLLPAFFARAANSIGNKILAGSFTSLRDERLTNSTQGFKSLFAFDASERIVSLDCPVLLGLVYSNQTVNPRLAPEAIRLRVSRLHLHLAEVQHNASLSPSRPASASNGRLEFTSLRPKNQRPRPTIKMRSKPPPGQESKRITFASNFAAFMAFYSSRCSACRRAPTGAVFHLLSEDNQNALVR
jgi:hypothetical protein